MPTTTRPEGIKNILSFIFFICLYSCSFSSQDIDLLTANPFLETEQEQLDEELLIYDGAESFEKDIIEKSKDNSISQMMVSDEKKMPESEAQVKKDEEFANYRVRPNDTLMYIAHKIYGHYGHWREIHKLNEDQIGDDYKLKVGQLLKYRKPQKGYIPPDGHPYLVKKNDTLGIISDLVYGDAQKWPIIWKNNDQLITDPNIIFAGFTIFYPDIENIDPQRDFASLMPSEQNTTEL